MKIYVMFMDGIVQTTGFTSLFGICEYYSLCYSSAAKGKRVWEGKQIIEVDVKKIKGRGKR